MSETTPFLSIIVPARPTDTEVRAVAAVRALDYPHDRLELLVVRGRQPAVQRNAALQAARGELVYFLDDDSVPDPANLRRALVHFARPEVQMVGGPNLCPDDAPGIERIFAVVLASWLAFGPSRARYAPVGATRTTSEKELILCNLMARRDAVLALGGFDASLYPNEENALMDGLQQRGGVLVYDPAFVARRRPRPTLRAFCRMLTGYGRGRAEQFRLHPTPGSALNFVPPLFCLYLALVPLAFALRGGAALPVLLPLAAYALAVAAQTLALVPAHGAVRALSAAPLQLLTHICYGGGFWKGLFTRPQPRTAEDAGVRLEKLVV